MNFVSMAPDFPASAVTEDTVLGGRLRLLQPRRGHRAGHDAVLLAAAVSARGGEHLVDLGAGVGTAGLAAAVRVPKLKVTLLDVDPALVALAERNIALNGLANRVRPVCLDVGASPRAFAAHGLRPDGAHHVIMNPPFHAAGRQRLSSLPERRRARFAPEGSLAAWVAAAARLLRPAGSLTLIWRADGLAEVLSALAGRFGALAVLPVQARASEPAIRVIVRGLLGRRTPLALLPALVLNDENGHPQEATEAIMRRGAPLPLAKA